MSETRERLYRAIDGLLDAMDQNKDIGEPVEELMNAMLVDKAANKKPEETTPVNDNYGGPPAQVIKDRQALAEGMSSAIEYAKPMFPIGTEVNAQRFVNSKKTNHYRGTIVSVTPALKDFNTNNGYKQWYPNKYRVKVFGFENGEPWEFSENDLSFITN